ncbi:ATP-binding cassette domain-containing protein, partial [Pelagibacteraceae bacterium]|nr:ATP-binding cassette domain-containing protein [Pelagibacteraceae bacterium]
YLSWSLRSHYANLLMNKYANSLYESVIDKKTGEIINATLTETNRAAQAVRYLIEFLTKLFLLVSLLLLLLISNFYITVSIIIIIGLIIILFRGLISNFSMKIGKKRLLLSQEHTEKCTELIESIKESKILGLNEKLLKSFDSVVTKYSKINILFTFLTGMPQVLAEFFLIFIFVAVIIFISFFNYDVNQVLPMLTLYFLVSMRLIQTFSAMTMLRMKYTSLIPSVSNVINYVDETLKQEDIYGSKIDKISTSIEIKDLYFSYGKNKNIFNGINCKIEKDKFTGIVGYSGSGKSTLINILTMLLFPTNGKISVNSRDLNEINISSWRNQIGYVSQSPFLFNDTIYNNILYGRLDASREEIIEACKMADAMDFINKLPSKFDTEVGQRGAALSGGQLQRIAIARAIVRRPSLFIFDECTSALDLNAEKSIIETIESLAKKFTVIVISHKKEVIKNADKFFEIKDNNILVK